MTNIIIGLTAQGLSLLRTMERSGISVIAFSMSKDVVGWHSKYGDKRLFSTAEDLRIQLEDILLLHSYKINCYVTSGELLAFILREFKELYDICNVISSPYAIVEKLSHKDLMYAIARDNGVFVSKYVTLDKYEDGCLSFPFFMKRNYEIPLFFKAVKIENKQVFNDYFNRIKSDERKHIVVQELIDIPLKETMYITAQLYYHKGFSKGCFIGEQVRRLSKGITSYIEEIENDAIIKQIKQICIPFMQELNYTGFAEFEFMMDRKKNELFFVEINTRPCGTHSALNYKFSNLSSLYIEANNPPLLIARMKKVKWMNIVRDVRSRIESKNISSIFDIIFAKYDILDIKDIKPFIFQFLR